MKKALFALILLGIIFVMGCGSNGDNAVTPPSENIFNTELNRNSAGRNILAVGRIGIDPETLEAKFIPDREAAKHWDVTPMLQPPNCSDCLSIEVIELDIDNNYANIKAIVKNKTDLTAYDVRGVIMPSVSYVFLQNPDSYTDLYASEGDIHAFRAFATDQPQRQVGPYTSHARGFEFFFWGFPNLIDTGFVIDASWPVNAKEPYEVTGAYTTGPFIDNQTSEIWVEVKSWNDDVELVTVDLSPLGWPDPVPMTHQYDDWYSVEASWQPGGDDPDDYNVLISAKCAGSNLNLYGVVSIEFQVSPPTVGWGRAWGSEEAAAGDVVVDSLDNILMTGDFLDTCDFDPSWGEYEITTVGMSDAFLTKFDYEGSFQWAVAWGGAYDDDGLGMALDDAENIYITGCYSVSADFDPGPGSFELSANGASDAYLMKLDSTGALLWVRTFGGAQTDHGYVVTVDGSDVYVGGDFMETVDFDPTAGIDERTAVAKADGFLCKYSTDGDYLWTVVIDGDNPGWGDSVKEIIVDATGDVYVGGAVTGTSDLDPDPVLTQMYTATGFYDAFLIKYTSLGDLVWANAWGGDDWDIIHGITLDPTGYVYVSGDFLHTVDFDPGVGVEEITANGAFDAFVSKFDTDGNFMWVKTWGGDAEYWDRAADIDIDSSGFLYITGYFAGEADFGLGGPPNILTSAGMSDSFLMKMDDAGNPVWVSTWGGSSQDEPSNIMLDSFTNSIVTGGFRGSSDLRPGPGFSPANSGGFSMKMFLSKTGPEGIW